MKIIVLNSTNYQDKDLIIDAISEDKTFSFKVRNGQLPTCHYAWLNNPLTVAEVEFVDNPRYKNKVLKGASLLLSPLRTGDYNELLSINLAKEMVERMLQEEERYKAFDLLIAYIKVTLERPDNLLAKLILMAKIITIAGAKLEVDRCVFCGSQKDIVCFSFAEGGFVCRNCMVEDIPIDLTPFQMKLVRAIFTKDINENLPEESISIEDKEALLMKLTCYIRDGLGVYLDTPKFILDNLRK